MNGGQFFRRSLAMILACLCFSLVGCSQEQTPENYYVQGQLAADAGQTTDAIAELSQAINSNPNMVLAYEARGDLYQNQGQLRQALADYSKASTIDPHSFHAWYAIGVVNQALRQFQEAIAAYQKALELHPDDSLVAMNLGIVYTDAGQPYFGIIYGQRALETAPDSFDAWAALGVTYSKLAASNAAFRAQAINCFKQCLELEPDVQQVYLNLATVYLDGKDFDQAREVLQTAERLAPSPLVYERLGYSLFRLGNFDEASQAYNDALKMEPDYTPALNGLGVVDMTQAINGAPNSEALSKEALKLWQKSLELNDNQPLIQKLVQRFSTQSN
jgi:superkiller protein 3